MFALKILKIFILGGLLLLAAGSGPVPGQDKPGEEKIASPVASPDALPRVLAEGAAALEKEAAALKQREEAARQALTQAEGSLQEQEARVAALRASLAIKKVPLADAEEALNATTLHADKVTAQIKDLKEEIAGLTKEQEVRATTQATLQGEVARLKAAGHPVVKTRGMQRALARYQKWTAAQKQGAAQVLGRLQKRQEVLEKEQKLLSALQADLKKYVEDTWKAELLRRQERVSLTDQAVRLLQALAALPGQVLHGAADFVASGRLAAYLKDHAAQFIGLAVFFILIFWGTRRLAALISPTLAAWQTKAEIPGLKFLLSLAQIATANLLLLGLLFWVWAGFEALGLTGVPAAQTIFYFIGSLVILRLASRVVQAVFAGPKAGGLLPLDDAIARFYRRSLKLFLVYLLMGLAGLAGTELLAVPPASRHFLAYFFGVGLLVWAWWLLRRPYLTRLIPELPGPEFLKRPGWMRAVRALVLLLLGAIVLLALLGFHNLSLYIGRAAALTGGILLSLGLVAWGLGRMLHHLAHPEAGWVARRFPQYGTFLQRFYDLGRGLILALLGLAAVLGAMNVWGIKPQGLARFFQWLIWGPRLGPITLSPLNLAGAALALYLTFWLSRLTRNVMQSRVYPRTGWDQGIQYTISTTLHYVILVLGILISLNILGFPLTNLALVAGALGVGIGFGLQNIVNNFISGLILLFERPIKVGDILVIDGQWGTVKEIRVRSTIFQTADRAVLIIPNSELLSHKITNWTHHGWGPVRLALEVGVAYGSDVDLVSKLLLEAARANPKVLDQPPPEAFFKTFGDSALNFVLRFFIQSPEPRERLLVTHELNRAIMEAFARHGIEIPFPQHDLFIKNWPSGPGS